jgi:membrane-associated phospholipid phosphatase
MATGNHFWLDVLGGIVVASISLAVVYLQPLRRLRARAA